jgi:hypothetical protein
MMTANRHLPLSHAAKKSGSETRQRERRVSFRVTGDEYDQARTAAGAAGLTVASFARGRVVDAPQTHSRRKPRADVAALARLTAELNRVGGNINQIARALNQGNGEEVRWLQEAQSRLLETLKAVRAAMGFEE